MRMILLAFVLGISMTALAEENFYPNGPWLVSIGEKYICKAQDGTIKEIDPSQIQTIKVITNDKGPFEEDVFWKFEYDEGAFYYPQSADKDGKFLEYFQRLKGFNNTAFMKSMSSTQNAVFIVWDKNTL